MCHGHNHRGPPAPPHGYLGADFDRLLHRDSVQDLVLREEGSSPHGNVPADFVGLLLRSSRMQDLALRMEGVGVCAIFPAAAHRTIHGLLLLRSQLRLSHITLFMDGYPCSFVSP